MQLTMSAAYKAKQLLRDNISYVKRQLAARQRKACITVQMTTSKDTTSLLTHQKCTELHVQALTARLRYLHSQMTN